MSDSAAWARSVAINLRDCACRALSRERDIDEARSERGSSKETASEGVGCGCCVEVAAPEPSCCSEDAEADAPANRDMSCCMVDDMSPDLWTAAGDSTVVPCLASAQLPEALLDVVSGTQARVIVHESPRPRSVPLHLEHCSFLA